MKLAFMNMFQFLLCFLFFAMRPINGNMKHRKLHKIEQKQGYGYWSGEQTKANE